MRGFGDLLLLLFTWNHNFLLLIIGFGLPKGQRYQPVWIVFRGPDTIILLVSCVVPVCLVLNYIYKLG